jgi:predicted outer membrane repeat protein
LPAVTNLAGPKHRKCNYNIDFQGKAVHLLSSGSSNTTATIDCGLKSIKLDFLSRPMPWLNFPRRGFMMVNGEGSDTIVGPGIVVQHCAANQWVYANHRSHPGYSFVDWNGGGFFIASDGTRTDGPVIHGVTVQKCSAGDGGGMHVVNAHLHLKNVSILNCGYNNGPAMSVVSTRKVNLKWEGGKVVNSASYRSGAIAIQNWGREVQVSFNGVSFDNNVQAPSSSYPNDEWKHSGGAVTVCESGSTKTVELAFQRCSFTQNTARRYGGAVYISKNVKTATFNQCEFNGNAASLGGNDVYVKEHAANDGTPTITIIDAVSSTTLLLFFLSWCFLFFYFYYSLTKSTNILSIYNVHVIFHLLILTGC